MTQTDSANVQINTREVLRFAKGNSSLGRFLALVSDRGLVAFEFVMGEGAIQNSFRARFPHANIIEDNNGLSDVLAALSQAIETPAVRPDLPLDLRGSVYEIKVWTMLREIQAGETTHYGALAARLGTSDAREITVAIASNPIAILIPCHRVTKKDGSISGYRWGVRRKRILLQREQEARVLPDAETSAGAKDAQNTEGKVRVRW